MAPGISRSEDRQAALIEVVSSIMARGTIHDLFSDVLEKLGRFVHFDRLVLLLSDEAAGTITLSEVCSTLPHNAPVGLVYRMEESPAGEAIRTQQRVYIADVETDRRYPYVIELLRQEQLRVFCYLPLTSPARRIGALGFGTRAAIQYSEEDLGLIERAMQPVAIAVENILNRHSVERERDRLKLLLEVNNALVTRLDPQDLFAHISGLLEDSVPHEYLAVSLWDPESGHLRLKFVVNPKTEDYRDLPLPPGTPSGDAFDAGVARVYDARYIWNLSGPVGKMLRSEHIRSICAIPLQTVRGKIGVITVGSRQERAYRPSVMERLEMLCGQLAIAVDNAMAYAKMEELNRRLRDAKMYLEEEIQTASASDEILGASSGIRRVLQEIETVASTDATVLIQGETGSGKELVARALHLKSPRAKGTFVKLNCAAIPTGLLESELFGHERGAFTGAIAQKIGRFEIAHQGTLFLDEIGEIPLDLQPKLLRVLQEKEFERLGSTRTIRTDARLVAATNRDLKQMAEAGQFRSDLFYRLNVFPIRVPPLRERRDDIAGLVMHFTQQYARRFGKKIVAIPTEMVSELLAYHWPGNIRELQNLIERSVILTQGDTLRIPVHELDVARDEPGPPATRSAEVGEAPSTMQEIERQAILGALRDARGVVGGTKGAAAKLGMKRTSLLYRMEKLGIKKPA